MTFSAGSSRSISSLSTLSTTTATISQIQCQSAGSCEQMLVKNCTITSINGTTKDAVIENSVVGTLHAGPTSYGVGRSIAIRNSAVASIRDMTRQIILTNAILATINASGTGLLRIPAETVRTTDARLDLIASADAWYIIGAPSYGTVGPTFQILNSWRDGNDICYQTTLSGTVSSIAAGADRIHTHPSPQFVVENCTGHQLITSHSRLGASGAKLANSTHLATLFLRSRSAPMKYPSTASGCKKDAI